MKNLVLVGFMGSGKTSAGRLAARRLGMRFVDTDELIEQRSGQTISQLFAGKGEPHFRALERALVRELAGEKGLVISTGGGMVLNPDNIQDFGRTGVVVSLWVEPQIAHKRTKHANYRPLLEGADRLEQIESLLKQRGPLYRAITPCIDTSAMTVEEQADEIVRVYKQST